NLSSSPDLCFFFFHTSALTEIYTLSLHDALPISSVYIKDKARGIGAALMIWLFFTLIFDGLVLFLLFQLIDYPLENLIVVLSALNPVDLVRIVSLMEMDVSALMGATTAVFKKNFTGGTGSLMTYAVLSLWAIIPLYFSLRKFNRKDL